jgi:hypothetical protein
MRVHSPLRMIHRIDGFAADIEQRSSDEYVAEPTLPRGPTYNDVLAVAKEGLGARIENPQGVSDGEMDAILRRTAAQYPESDSSSVVGRNLQAFVEGEFRLRFAEATEPGAKYNGLIRRAEKEMGNEEEADKPLQVAASGSL